MRKLLIATVIAALSVSLSAQTDTVKSLLDQLTATTQALRTMLAPPTIKVSAGGNLQAAVDMAIPGTTILVAPGTYTGNLVLRKKATAGLITIRTDGLDDTKLPPTIRVTPVQSGQMAKLKPRDPLNPVITTEPGASGYTLIGLDVGGVAPDRDVIVIGELTYTSVAQLPADITLDRMLIHGDNGKGHRGVMMNAVNGSVINSDVRGFVEIGRDSQAIAVINTMGPTLIENNYLEATGENFLTGGADPRIPGALPSNLLVRGNYITKPQIWRTTAKGSVKNLLELKLCNRCVIENNVLDGSWTDAQAGQGMLLTNRNQDGTAPWSTIRDILVQYNLFRNIDGACIQMLGLDDHSGIVTIQGVNLAITNNLFYCGNGFQLNNGFQPTIIQHNTMVKSNNWFLQFTNNPIPTGLFTFQDNIATSGQYGVVGDGTGLGVPTLTVKAPGAIFNYNVIEKAPYYIAYPVGNFEVTNLAAKFDSNKKYTGSEIGSDGKQPGADIDELQRRIPGVSW